MKPVEFITNHRPRFSEIDPYGHLNSKHYFDYISENRMIGHREVLGLGVGEFAKLPFAVITKKFEIEFRRPILIEQEFVIKSWVDEVGEVSADIAVEMTVGGKSAAAAKLVLVSLNKETLKPVAWDDDFLAKFFIRGE